jgi:endonuclease YncB( thermonuclease family)
MFGKSFYLIAIFCLSASAAFSQKTADSTGTTDKTKKIAAEQFEEIHLLVEGKVKAVNEGDTITVESKAEKTYLVRLLAIDAPEKGQEFGEQSRKKLAEFVQGKDVTVILRKKDSTSGLYIASVYAGGEDVSRKQIENGMAWHFRQNGHEQKEEGRNVYEQAERRARAARKGLWAAAKEPVAPWEYRAANSVKNEVKQGVEKETPPTSGASNNETKEAADPATNSAKQSNDGRKYIKGPRGGCYYINSKGGKTYVDRNLCN